MSAADRPMWTCPSCGHRVVSANIWHWCTQIRLDDAFARSTDGVDAIDDGAAAR